MSTLSTFSKSASLRKWMIKNMAPIIFLSAFFVTIVLGNVLFLTEFGREQLGRVPSYIAIYDFPTIFTPKYWLLLLLPFLIVPPIVMLIQRNLDTPVKALCSKIPEIQPLDYAVFVGIALGHVGYSLWQAEAFSLYGAGGDAVSSVEIRFQILAGLRFWTMTILMSILPYLAVYGLIRCFRHSGFFWNLATFLVVVVVSIYMIFLNMKWPFLIFEAALLLTVFSYARTYPYLKTLVGAVALFAAYLIISTYVFRLADPMLSKDVVLTELVESVPLPSTAESAVVTELVESVPLPSTAESAVVTELMESTPLSNSAEIVDRNFQRLIERAMTLAPDIVFSGLTRMAIPYPFYYQIFTEEGSVCGGIIEQARVGPDCRPSTYIYTRIFGRDGFEGRGTAPSAVHISGYSLGGWPIALFAMMCAAVILGLITCLPQDSSAMIGALGIMGAVAGYHFSQLPGEGPLFGDHGLVWTLIAMGLYIAWRRLRSSP